jgi:prephenate dehydratase
MDIAERLRTARRTAALTQADLARALHVSQPTINRWEAGEAEPSRVQIEGLARRLDIDPAWLAFGQRPAGPPARDSAPSRKQETSMASTSKAAPKVVAFQGQPGAYSHLACKQVLPEWEAVACDTFEDAFAAVETGAADLGMIPIENSLGGRVADIHHLLPDSNLYIVGEHFQPVHHYLLAPKGATLSSIKRVMSHPQGLAQCREITRELGLQAVQRADTAGAAAEIAESGDITCAAFASELAGEIYGMEVLRARVEDRIGNTTRFLLMSRRREEPDPRSGPAITSFVFQVRSVPAALYKALGGFATTGVNTVKLESYISVTNQNVARFYAEIEGHPADKQVDYALQELQYFSTMVKILGVYPAHPFREKAAEMMAG